MSSYGPRIPADQAMAAYEKLARQVETLAPARGSVPNCRIEPAGSLRRGLPTVGDLDVVVDGTNPEWVQTVTAALRAVAQEVRTTKEGKVTGGVIDGCPVEFYVSRPGAFEPMLLFAIGSKEFNVQQRALAAKRGLMLSQHGLFKASVDAKGKRVAGELVTTGTLEIFEAIGMGYVPPVDRNW